MERAAGRRAAGSRASVGAVRRSSGPARWRFDAAPPRPPWQPGNTAAGRGLRKIAAQLELDVRPCSRWVWTRDGPWSPADRGGVSAQMGAAIGETDARPQPHPPSRRPSARPSGRVTGFAGRLGARRLLGRSIPPAQRSGRRRHRLALPAVGPADDAGLAGRRRAAAARGTSAGRTRVSWRPAVRARRWSSWLRPRPWARQTKLSRRPRLRARPRRASLKAAAERRAFISSALQEAKGPPHKTVLVARRVLSGTATPGRDGMTRHEGQP